MTSAAPSVPEYENAMSSTKKCPGNDTSGGAPIIAKPPTTKASAASGATVALARSAPARRSIAPAATSCWDAWDARGGRREGDDEHREGGENARGLLRAGGAPAEGALGPTEPAPAEDGAVGARLLHDIAARTGGGGVIPPGEWTEARRGWMK